MSGSAGDHDETRTTPGPQGDFAAFQNDLLAVWLEDAASGRTRELAEYQAMFPGREAAVAAELAAWAADADPDELHDAPSIPEVELLGRVGRGGQGVVYRGRQRYLGREVAVKVFPPRLFADALASRFQREAKTLAALRHPNIVACYSAGVTDSGHGYMVMEYVDGPNLRQWIGEHGPLPTQQALALCRDLARALEHARSVDIIHRDVKPENVLLRSLPAPAADGLPFEVKLADLGLARSGTRLVGELGATQLTPVGAVLGSPRTMAPEQFDDPDGVDFRADIYGLGCVLYHALVGRPAFQGSTLTAAIQEKVAAAGPDLAPVVRCAGPAVAALLRSMLAPRRADRPASHAAVAAACDEQLGVAGPRRRRRGLVAGAALVLVLAVLAVFDPLGVVRPPRLEVVGATEVLEGQAVSLRAVGSGRGRLRYAWRQLDAPAVRWLSRAGAEARFEAPRGLGDRAFRFAVTVDNGWRSAERQHRIQVRADPDLAAVPAGTRRDLFRPGFGATVQDWTAASAKGQWGTSEQGHLGADGYCDGAETARRRLLPRGDWTLRGAVEPFAEFFRADGQPARTARVGVALEFGSGDRVALVVRRRGDGFEAGVGRRPADADGTWPLTGVQAGDWSAGRPLPFAMRWQGGQLVVEIGAGPAPRRQVFAAADLPALPPYAVTLFVADGRACFCELTLTGH